MQSAETVLSVIRERGRRGLPLERLYRQLFNPQLFLLAYGRIYANTGATTPGVSAETVDGMSLAKINRIIGALRAESYRWSAARRVYIPKRNGKLRPLGMPPWSDKLVAEVVRLLLEAYYDVWFSDRSHGFRPGRGCHTALDEVVSVWKGTHWFIEGDIEACFDEISHSALMERVRRRIGDRRVLALVRAFRKAGILTQDGATRDTVTGTPQGGILSPLLSNVARSVLDEHIVEHGQASAPSWVRQRRRHQGLPNYRIVRYADDGVPRTLKEVPV